MAYMSNDIVPVLPEFELTSEESLFVQYMGTGGAVYHGGDAESVQYIEGNLPPFLTDSDYDSLMFRYAGNFNAVVAAYYNSYSAFKDAARRGLADIGGWVLTPARIDQIVAKLSDLCARIIKVLPSLGADEIDSRLRATGFKNNGISYDLTIARVNATIFSNNSVWRYSVDVFPVDGDLFENDFEFFVTTAVQFTVAYEMGQASQAAINSGNVAGQYALAAVNSVKAGVNGDFNDILSNFGQSALKIWAAPVDSSGVGGDTVAQTSGVNMAGIDDPIRYADFDIDYTASFDPVGYSSGEGFPISSDSQIVDFGFGATAPDASVHYQWGDQLIDPAPTSDGFNVTFGATPEQTTSAFGATTYPMQTQGESSFSLNSVKSAVQTAQSIKGAVVGVKSLLASGGGAKFSAATPPYAATGSQNGGLAVQRESNLITMARGQLSPGGTAVASSHSSVMLVVAIAALGLFAIRKVA